MNYEQEQQFAAEVKRYVTEHLPLSQISDSELQQQIEDIVEQRIGAGYCSIEQRVSIVEQVYSSIRGFGLLDSIIKDDTITEVMINGPENVFIEQNGRLFKLDKQFESQRKLEDIIQRIVGLAGREVNQANPICDTRLPDGSRVNVVLPPIALCGPTVTIRKFSKTPMTIAKLIEYGSLTQEIADKLQMLVEAKYNIFISGGTGSGKTTFLNALSNYIPKDERVITIEDSAELQIEGIENLVSLETRNANASGAGQITIRDLIKSSLRMRPERIIVGEVRGGEALDMLQAMNTGHDGSLSTGHANSTEDMLSRLETMVLQGAAGLPLEAIRQQIASAVDIIIHLSRLRDKSRKTMEITEVVGYEDGRIVLNPLYVFEEDENVTSMEYSIKIDITKPIINIEYDKNAADSGTFFRESRRATITVKERNFDDSLVNITLRATNDGADIALPTVSGWTSSGDLHTATIEYTAEGDYTFAIACTDQAGNPNEPVYYADGTVAPTAFTIDKTRPTISVTYDNNSALNGNYYNANRTATVVVTEHNFDASRVNITLRATDDGADIALPTVSGWTSSGDRHTATIAYRRDGLYTFDIDVTDKAGNTSADFTEQTFYVDTTAPTLEITGVADRSANNGDIIPVVSYSDTNYDDAQVNITLTGAMRKGVALDGSYADQHNGKVFTFKNFAKEKEVDDIYTLAATLTDKAGNTTEKTILFSANRFGSTYALSAATDQLNGSYVQTPQDVVVTETNPDALQNIRITLFKNNQTIILQEGTDYRIEVRGGNGQWYEYIYTVLAKNFADDGVYRLTFYSEDAAGNIAENTLDTKKQEIGFGVDKTKPNMVVTNLESDTTYPLENLTVSLSAGDNLLLQSVVVYLDDYSKAYKTWTAEEVAAIVADQGEFTFDIPGDSTGAHQVKIVCTDAAGNEQTEEITNFYVTTNLFVRYYNNKPLFFGSIAAVVVIAGVVIALAAGKKKKNDKEK